MSKFKVHFPLLAAPFFSLILIASSALAQGICGNADSQSTTHPVSQRTPRIDNRPPQLKLLFIRVRFADTPSPYPTSSGNLALNDALANQLNLSLRQYYENVSYGQQTIEATLTPVYTLPYNTPSNLTCETNEPPPCNWVGIKDWALASAAADGYNLSDFQRKAIAASHVYTGWAGQAFGDGYYLNGAWSQNGSAHEFGHTLGLGHVLYWQSTDGTPNGYGYGIPYLNPLDVMGYGSIEFPDWAKGHFHAPNKFHLGYLTLGDGPLSIKEITESGVYRIYQYETDLGPGPRALRVRYGVPYYYVEFRQEQFNYFPSTRLMNGAIVTRSTGSLSDLLDMTPETPGQSTPFPSGVFDSPLVLGQTFSDHTYGIHITPIRKGNTSPQSLDIAISLSNDPNNVAPTVMLSQSATSVSAGETFTVTAQAADGNGDQLAYYWQFSNGSGTPLTQIIGPNNRLLRMSLAAPGSYNISCTVSDMRGGSVSAAVALNVTP